MSDTTHQRTDSTTDRDDRPVLVYGAAGARGSAVAHGLLDRGRRVRVLGHVPHPGAAAVLDAVAARGAEVVPGDLDDPASLVAASVGARHVFLHPPLVGRPDRTLEQMAAALQAAQAAGVERVVLATNSALPPDPCGVPAVEVNRDVEALLAGTDVPGVVLRPTLYLGNLLAPWSLPRILERGELAYPLPEHVPVSWLAPEDAAEAAVLALTADLTAELTAGRTDGVGDRLVVPLGGPRPVGGPELAQAVAAAAGREVHYVAVSPGAFGDALAPVLGPEAAAGVAELYAYLSGPGREVLQASAQPAQVALGLRTRGVGSWAGAQHWG